MNAINCEDEKIQFLGLIQNLGCLIVFNREGIVEAVSENIDTYFPSAGFVIGSRFSKISLPDFNGFDFLQNALETFNKTNTYKKTTHIVEVNGFAHYLTLSSFNNLLYVELEICSNNEAVNVDINNNKLLDLQQADEDIWTALTSILSETLAIDRVMVYQFNEDQSGVVIAESLKDNKLDSYLGIHYPEFDIPQQARALYKKVHCRYIADIHADPIPVVHQNDNLINLETVGIRNLSPIHLQYLSNAGFKSSISFSILVKGELWGLVCCQHTQSKHVDLGLRNFSLLAVHVAANKFQQLEEEKKTIYLQEIQELELMLQEKLLLKYNFFPELKTFAPELMHLLDADGIAIGFEDAIYFEGLQPEKEHLKKALPELRKRSTDRIFTSHSLSDQTTLHQAMGNSPIAGIAFAEIDRKSDFFIAWFRREVITDRNWAGKPEKLYEEDKVQGLIKPSPRTSFQIWREQISGTSSQWSQKQLHFMVRIREVLRDSLVNKAVEIDNLNTQLIEMNTALDTYAYTISHDLKNPLSAIKISSEFLKYKNDLKPELIKKMSTNILDSVHTILNMLEKIHLFSKASSFNFVPEQVEPENFIHEIIDTSKLRFGAPDMEVHVDRLLPVMGEKTLLYQLFLNLIGNAIKYSAKADNAAVYVSSMRTERGISYSISDNGIGIDEHELASIYEMFKRMSNSSGYEGSGVGMAIVKRIVDKLNIDISIQSIINRGTTVTLLFLDT
ncbi:ATP-binding protein [Sphingobacterium sp. UT-1RO-CII-1]|uniref:ATP-binding protein n=1 Tax=Sphingobacterium sp. UT-1RO-CII-1 TaxID=2995225 RepID=UPI00227AA4C0|nr:ATP-binding protein [Sphingobacterium sp. UT-1RO-CII-1]MCY4778921.1 ATP-binding protein [Sphingobacterium sp. UT-1RO-CII-1]